MLATLKSGNTSSIHLLFGVRFTEDLFYLAEIQAIQSKYPNFNYEVFVSREKYEGCKKGYITDALTPDIIENFSEFYVCGAPVVVDSVNEKLLA
ncbi:MAG: hypothetical protein H6767_02130 [Candidatus Peribacteria bacterium]|nr:MAG: hypothetical protein H6767_02130 [Candidatus Peribacteria bacterium]